MMTSSKSFSTTKEKRKKEREKEREKGTTASLKAPPLRQRVSVPPEIKCMEGAKERERERETVSGGAVSVYVDGECVCRNLRRHSHDAPVLLLCVRQTLSFDVGMWSTCVCALFSESKRG